MARRRTTTATGKAGAAVHTPGTPGRRSGHAARNGFEIREVRAVGRTLNEIRLILSGRGGADGPGRLGGGRDGGGEWGVGGFERQVFLAGVVTEHRAALAGDVVADRAAEHRVAGL